MKELRDVLEVDLGDIPTKAIDNGKNGFYLFVRGDVELDDSVEGVERVAYKTKEYNVTAKYLFPLIKKDLAMFVFYKLRNFSYKHYKQATKSHEECEEYRCIIKPFLPLSDSSCNPVTKITNIYMLLCNEGNVIEVVYDPEYQLKGYEELRRQEILTNKGFDDIYTTFSGFDYKIEL